MNVFESHPSVSVKLLSDWVWYCDILLVLCQLMPIETSYHYNSYLGVNTYRLYLYWCAYKCISTFWCVLIWIGVHWCVFMWVDVWYIWSTLRSYHRLLRTDQTKTHPSLLYIAFRLLYSGSKALTPIQKISGRILDFRWFWIWGDNLWVTDLPSDNYTPDKLLTQMWNLELSDFEPDGSVYPWIVSFFYLELSSLVAWMDGNQKRILILLGGDLSWVSLQG